MSRFITRITERLGRLSTPQVRIIYTVIAVVALLWVGLVTLTQYLALDHHTDECIWKTDTRNNVPALIVDTITPGGAAARAGIQKGDRVISIDSISMEGVGNEAFLLIHAEAALNATPVDTPIPYVVERDGRRIPLMITLKEVKRSFTRDSLPFLLPTVTFIWLLVGIMVILSQPRGTMQRRFFLTAATSVFALSSLGMFTSNALVLEISPSVADSLDTIQVMVGAFFFTFWLRFSASFPIERPIFSTTGRKALLWFPTISTLVLSITFMFLPFDSPKEITGKWWIIVIITNSLLLMVWVISFFSGVWLLYRGYRQLPATADRRPMRIILIGTCLTAFVPVYIVLIGFAEQFIGNIGRVGEILLLPLILLPALPLSFGYAIFRYQVMDFRRAVSTTMVYVATMALIVAIYIGLGYAVSQVFGAMAGRLGATLQIVGFVFFLLLFDPLKRQMQTAIENRFFPQRRDFSEHVREFSEQVSQMVSTREVAGLLASTLSQTLDIPDVCVVLHEETAEPTVAARSHDDVDSSIDTESMRVLQRHLQDHHGLLALETLSDPQLDTIRQTYPYVVGLYAHNELIGAVLLGVSSDGGVISGRQIQFIVSVATQGSAALEVVRLLEKELSRQRYLEELATARRIQQSILPMTIPDLPGISVSAMSSPAQSVGGDYFNAIHLNDGRVLVIVADVSGKGLPASFYMVQLHGMVCIASTTCTTLVEMLSTINDHLHREMPRGTFITATALLFDTDRQMLSLVRAGHTPVLYCNDHGIIAFAPPGPALGFVHGPQFVSMLHEQQISYNANDTFVLYSDGVSEMMNARLEEFGDERLHGLVAGTNALHADVIRDNIVAAVDGFRAGAEQNDDMTIVVIRVNKGMDQAVEEPVGMIASTEA